MNPSLIDCEHFIWYTLSVHRYRTCGASTDMLISTYTLSDTLWGMFLVCVGDVKDLPVCMGYTWEGGSTNNQVTL